MSGRAPSGLSVSLATSGVKLWRLLAIVEAFQVLTPELNFERKGDSMGMPKSRVHGFLAFISVIQGIVIAFSSFDRRLESAVEMKGSN
jgi:hypothetical protein